MLTTVVFVPTPPLLVPELAGAAAAATQQLRDACLQAIGVLAEQTRSWIAIAANAADTHLGPDTAGTWQPFGARVPVAFSPTGLGRTGAELPLPALIAAWLRGRAARDATIQMDLYADDTPPARCRELGRELDNGVFHGLLVLGDGCTTLSEKAPGAFDERAAGLQNRIDRALATADTRAIGELDAQRCVELGVSGRVPWQIAAAVGGEWQGRSMYAGAPYGVGYQVAVWQR
ncbi:MAG: hypothetical protein ABI251_15605 [Mycobacteriaceae bacterium]